MRTFVCALATAALMSPALAETWVEISKSPHSTVSIDGDSAEHSGTRVKFWMRTVFDAEHPIGIYGGKPMKGENLLGTTRFVEMRNLIDLDCAARTFANPVVRFYDMSGKLVSDAAGATEAKPFTSTMMVASGADMFCSKQ